MIFGLLIIHNRDRMSSITRILHSTTWVYFTEHLAYRFIRSSKDVKEEIMTDINDLVQEFLSSSSDEHQENGNLLFGTLRHLLMLSNALGGFFYLHLLLKNSKSSYK